MAVGDVYELVQSYRVRGEYCQNILHYREKTAETDPVPARELATAWHAVIVPELVALLSDEVQLACVYVRRISPSPGIAFTVLQTDPGEVASEAVPTTSAILMTWYTATFTKQGRGRNYWPGLPESSQNSGSLAAAELTAWNDLQTLMFDDLNAPVGPGVWELAVWSALATTAHLVTAGVVRTNLATMRSRRQKPGVS